MKQRVRIMTAGFAAPEGGPFRDEYLRKNGESFLAGTHTALEEVVRVMAGYKVPLVKLVNNVERDRRHIGAVVRRWEEIRADFGARIEVEIREPLEAAMENAVDALNFLEDTELKETAHELVHQVAWLRFGFLGCKLWVQDGSVQSDCPVRLAHRRWGFSPELTTKWACSICGERIDSNACVHIPEEDYEVIVDRSGAFCSACFEEECDHEHNTTLRMPAQRIATDIKTIALAMVARPRDPRARMASVPISVPADSEMFRKAEAGEGLCTECILPCSGFIVPDDLH